MIFCQFHRIILNNTRILSISCGVILMLAFSCNENDQEGMNNTGDYTVPGKSKTLIQTVFKGYNDSLNMVPAKFSTVRAGEPDIFPVNNIRTFKAGPPQVTEIDSAKLLFITPGLDAVPNPKVVVLPEPTQSNLNSIISLGEYEIQNGETVFPLSFERAKHPEPVLLYPMRIKESARINIQYLSIEQGLNNPNVNSIIQDRKGNMWLGLQNGGLCRYDGVSLIRYTQQEGLFQDDVRPICEDSEGNIWVGTHWGICKFDGRVFNYGSFTEGLLYSPINTIVETKDKAIWIGATKGLIRYKGDTCTIYTDQTGLPSSDVRTLYEDQDGNIWIGTPRGICKFDGTSFVQFSMFRTLSIRTIVEDNNGNIWFGGEGKGIYRYDGEGLALYLNLKGLSNISSIISVENNGIWIGTYGNGLYTFDGDSFIQYTVHEGLSSNSILSMIEDDYQNIWLTTEGGGVMKIERNLFSFMPQLSDIGTGEISSITEDMRGELWLSIFGAGIVRFDGNSFKMMSEEEGLYNNFISAIFEDQKGDIWIGNNHNGVQKFDGETYTHFHELESGDSSFIPGQVNCIEEDKNGNIWWGTRGEGLKKFDGSSITSFKGLGRRELEDVLCILPDHQGNIWFGMAGGNCKLFQYDGERLVRHDSYQNFPGARMITSIMEDGDSNLWIGTHGLGIMIYDGSNVVNFTKKDGLANNSISSIAEDGNGNIWVGTQRGLSLISPQGKNEYSIIAYGEGCGLKSLNFNRNAVCLDHQNRLWWGTGEIVTMLDLEKYYQNAPDQIEVQLSNVRINQKYIDYGGMLDNNNSREHGFEAISFSNVAQFHNYPSGLRLPHHLNHLTFDYSAIDWIAPQNVKYQFMLEGFDEQWSAPTLSNLADYRNIPPGKYNMKVKAMGTSNLWSEPFEYSFIIRPPLWKRWWAYTMYGIVLLLLARYYVKFIISRERIRAEVLIKKSEVEKMQELDQMKSRFFANVSHEFRTPLTLLLGPINDLLNNSDRLNEADRRLLGTMRGNAGRLMQLINQLLDLSRLETGKLKLEVEEGNLSGFVKTIVLSFLSLAETKGISLEHDLEQSETVTFFDPDKIEKILTNLISNALKFTPRGGSVKVVLLYSNNKDAASGIQAEILVTDTGLGIDEEDLEKIFNRFFQVRNSGYRGHEGSGIGLALTKEMVEFHKGTITVRSIPEKGSTFSVNVPVSREYFNENEMVETQKTVAKSGYQDGPGGLEPESEDPVQGRNQEKEKDRPLVLIVEDNSDLRQYISRNLAGNYRTVETENGKFGLQKAIESIPDLVISDLMMPEMDGMEMCERLKSDHRTSHIPLILLTAKAARDSKIESLEKGADDYILKPFDAEVLQVRVKNLIEQRKRLRERYRKEFLTGNVEQKIPPPEDSCLLRVMNCLKMHLSDTDFNVDKLGKEVGLSRTQLYRKILALTVQTPSELIRNARLKMAARMFHEGHKNVTRVMYSVGFNSSAYFAKYFRGLYGLNPSEYIRRNPEFES